MGLVLVLQELKSDQLRRVILVTRPRKIGEGILF